VGKLIRRAKPQKNPRRVRILTFRRGKSELIAGIDFDHPHASNVMGYVRSTGFEDGEAKDYPEFWLKLHEMDKLGVLLILSARFWAKTRRKGSVSRSEVESFEDFWRDLESQWPEIKPYRAS